MKYKMILLLIIIILVNIKQLIKIVQKIKIFTFYPKILKIIVIAS